MLLPLLLVSVFVLLLSKDNNMTIQVQSSLQVTGATGEFSFPRIGGATLQITQTIPGGGVPGFQKLTADTAEAVDIAELTALGMGYIKNTGDVKVEIGREIAAAFEKFNEIRPGEELPIRFALGIAPYLKAIGGAGEVQLLIFED